MAVTVKSNPKPESATTAAADAVLLVMLRLPLCAPAAAGTNSTPAVQLAPAASVAVQVLFTS